MIVDSSKILFLFMFFPRKEKLKIFLVKIIIWKRGLWPNFSNLIFWIGTDQEGVCSTWTFKMKKEVG